MPEHIIKLGAIESYHLFHSHAETIIADVAVRKRHQRMNKVLDFLPSSAIKDVYKTTLSGVCCQAYMLCKTCAFITNTYRVHTECTKMHQVS